MNWRNSCAGADETMGTRHPRLPKSAFRSGSLWPHSPLSHAHSCHFEPQHHWPSLRSVLVLLAGSKMHLDAGAASSQLHTQWQDMAGIAVPPQRWTPENPGTHTTPVGLCWFSGVDRITQFQGRRGFPGWGPAPGAASCAYSSKPSLTTRPSHLLHRTNPLAGPL